MIRRIVEDLSFAVSISTAFLIVLGVAALRSCQDAERREVAPLVWTGEQTLLLEVRPKDQPLAIPQVVDVARSFAMASGSDDPPRLYDSPELAKLGYLAISTGDLWPPGVVSAVSSVPYVRAVLEDGKRGPIVPMAGDPLIGAQWAHEKLGTSAAWSRGVTGKGVLVAVIDSGVQCDHPDLSCAAPVKDYTGEGGGDPNGHGTHVAGIVAARRGNGLGGAGIAPDAEILPVRVLDGEGYGYDSWIASGIVYAVDRGAKVVNLSLGGDEPQEVLRTALRYGVDRGVIFTCAAGNDGSSVASYPNSYPECVGVAATKKDGEAGTAWTNWGANADIGAPGEAIMSTCVTSRFCQMSGTSMASPVVAGVVALTLSGGVRWSDAIGLITRTGVPLSGKLSGLRRPDVPALSSFLVPATSSTKTPLATTTSTATSTSRPAATSTSSRTPVKFKTRTPTPRKTATRTPVARRTPRPRLPNWEALPFLLRRR